MSQTLEQRVELLERKLAELSGLITRHGEGEKNWRVTFGLSRDDTGFREMVRLGEEYRVRLRKEDRSAHP